MGESLRAFEAGQELLCHEVTGGPTTHWSELANKERYNQFVDEERYEKFGSQVSRTLSFFKVCFVFFCCVLGFLLWE